MKIRLVNWINLAVAIICFAAAIIGFCNSDVATIVVAVFNIIAGSWNLFIFLHAVSVWWEKSEKVRHKFIFTCPKCDHKFVPSFWRWILVPHIFSKRYFKCDRCRHYSWMRRK
jgi:ABC-type uncharacterized transport system permease subunit